MAIEDLRASIFDEAWSPGPPPKDGYPRLVRAGGARVAGWVLSHEVRQGEVINELAELAENKYVDADGRPKVRSKMLLKRVREMANKWCPPDAPETNTLENWIWLGYRAAAHLHAMQQLEDLGPEAFGEHVRGTWAERGEETLRAGREGRKTIISNYMYLASWLRGRDPSEYRLAISETLMSMAINGQPAYSWPAVGIALFMDLTDRLHYDLAIAWANGKAPRACAGCGRLFIPSQANTKVCSRRSTCRSAVSRRRRRAAS